MTLRDSSCTNFGKKRRRRQRKGRGPGEQGAERGALQRAPDNKHHSEPQGPAQVTRVWTAGFRPRSNTASQLDNVPLTAHGLIRRAALGGGRRGTVSYLTFLKT